MQRDSAALLDIYNAARLLLDFTAGVDRDLFLETREKQSSVLYQLVVIGEAARRLSSEFREQYPVAPWHRIVGLRNVLTHQYDSVDLDEVWVIVERDIPTLIAAVEPLIPPDEG